MPKIKPIIVGTTLVRVFFPNSKRTLIGMSNTHNTAIVYYNTDRTMCDANNGFPLFPKSTIVLEAEQGDDVGDSLFMISDTAATGIRIQEELNK